jgi:hypothetical protein
MQLSEELATFVAGPRFSHAGTRDKDLVAGYHIVMGVRASADRRQLLLNVPGPYAVSLRANAADNGQIAVGCSEAETHRTYQFKGRVVDVRDANAEDLASRDGWVAAMKPGLLAHGWTGLADVLEYVKAAPLVTVTMTVEQVFDQTPGPGAGEPLKVG